MEYDSQLSLHALVSVLPKKVSVYFPLSFISSCALSANSARRFTTPTSLPLSVQASERDRGYIQIPDVVAIHDTESLYWNAGIFTHAQAVSTRLRLAGYEAKLTVEYMCVLLITKGLLIF